MPHCFAAAIAELGFGVIRDFRRGWSTWCGPRLAEPNEGATRSSVEVQELTLRFLSGPIRIGLNEAMIVTVVGNPPLEACLGDFRMFS